MEQSGAPHGTVEKGRPHLPVETLEEPEVLPATRSPHGYLASYISDNISQREDGSLIIVGCPIARDGFQSYSVRNLPQEKARELGVDTSNPDAEIDLYRAPKDVFAPEFLASLNGVVITDNHPPPGVFVDSRNFKDYSAGHIQNPRKAPEPLEDGNWPVIADLIISGEPLVSKVLNKTAREISLGYDFGIERDGDKICQNNMRANHCAIVPNGRAGDFVSIQDALPEPPGEVDQEAASNLVSLDAKSSEVPTAPAPPAYIPIQFNPSKEKTTVKANKLLRLFMGKHLIEMARATDASPEAIMDAVESLPPKEDEPIPAVADKKAKDAEIIPAEPEDDDVESQDRKRMHDALDCMLDEPSARDSKRRGRAKDADLEELKSLLSQFFSEEEAEPEHAADEPEEVDPSQLEAALEPEVEDSEAEPGEEEDPDGEEELAADGDDPIIEEPEDADVEDKRKAKDRGRAADGAKETLRMLRPFVARVNDASLNKAFNTALGVVTKKSRATATDGGYGGFARAARARDDAPRNPNPRARAADGAAESKDQKLQAAYDAARGGK